MTERAATKRPHPDPDRLAALRDALAARILVLDGAMGTMIQRHELEERDFRGERFAGSERDLKGNFDLLSLTAPQVITEIHQAFLEAGADMVSTNTFNATRTSQADYGTEDLAHEINVAAAGLARAAVDAMTEKTPDRPRFVAGAIGPTNKTTSLSPDVNDPGMRAITFDQLKDDYRRSADGLIEGGADLLLVETIFDTLNAKAALYAIEEAFDERGTELPVMISGTITDLAGRTLSGQTVAAFWTSVRHVRPFSVGLNCSFGGRHLQPHVAELARIADTAVSCHPNAGLPNEFGEYNEGPEEAAEVLSELAREGQVNIVGGCCGTTPEHIRVLAEMVEGMSPRAIPELPKALRLSGLEPFEMAS